MCTSAPSGYHHIFKQNSMYMQTHTCKAPLAVIKKNLLETISPAHVKHIPKIRTSKMN